MYENKQRRSCVCSVEMVVDDKISLHMIYNGLWLYNLLVGLGLSTPEVIDANLEIKETILNCLKENLKI